MLSIVVTACIARLPRLFGSALLMFGVCVVVFGQQRGADGLGDRLYPRLGNGGYDARHYSIDLVFKPGSKRIAASAVIEAVALADLATFNLDLYELTVDSVRVNGTEAAYRREGSELVISPGKFIGESETFRVAIDYEGVPQPISDPATPFIELGWQEWGDGFFATVSQPSGSMNWFPCNNHPLDKATYSFRITVPQPLTAVANGVLRETIVKADGRRVFVWEMGQPMASYLAIVAVGEFVVARDDSGDVPIRNFFPVGVSDNVIARYDVTREMMVWLGDMLGPYPFEEYGVVVVPGVPTALETQSISIIGAAIPPEKLEHVILHELLHQWYGNGVTLAQWSDIWLHEGVATYFMALWVERTDGVASYDAMIRQFAEAVAGSTLAPGNLPVTELFGDVSYLGGALVLHGLRQEVGEEIFLDILRSFYQGNVYGSVASEDFIAVAESLSERDLDEFFAAWLYGERSPDLP